MRAKIKRLVPYLDDILLVSGGVCFAVAGGLFAGAALALAISGVWLTLLAVIVARGKGADSDDTETGDPS